MDAPQAARPSRLSARLAAQSEQFGRVIFPALVGLIVVVMGILVLYPLVRLLYEVFSARFDLDRVVQTLTAPDVVRAFGNTAVLALIAGGSALAIGAAFAWLNERTDARMGWAADMLPILPLLVPPLATAIGWVFLLAPRAGFLNATVRSIFTPDAGPLASGPVTIYTIVGMGWVTMVVTVPLAYLTVAAALRNMDPSLEEASRMSGRGPLSTLMHVSLPAIRPALATASVLLVIQIIAMYSVPAIIGAQTGLDVLAVLIRRMLYAGGIPRFDDAIILSVFMLLTVQVFILLEFAAARSGHHATIGGRGRSRARLALGVLRIPARVIMTAYLAAATVLPVGALALASFQPFWSAQIDTLTWDNYVFVFGKGSVLRDTFLNSVLLGVVTGTLLMVVAAVIAFYVASSSGPLARAVNALTGLPASVPHVVVGVALLVALGSGEPSLSGTLLLLFFAYLVVCLPQAARSAGAALVQVGRELWEASLMSSASPLRTFVRVLLPLMLPGLLAGWVIVFVHSFSEISASVFLSGPRNPVTGPAIVDLWLSGGTLSQLAALTLAVTAVQTAIVLAVQLTGRRRLLYLG